MFIYHKLLAETRSIGFPSGMDRINMLTSNSTRIGGSQFDGFVLCKSIMIG